MEQVHRILVTGENRDFEEKVPLTGNLAGKHLEWISWPVLQFEKLTVDSELLQRLGAQPFEWIIFASPRAVNFWTETLVEAGIDFPLETQVACIGESTFDVAGADGYTPDFFPTEPGSEKFLEEFADLLSNSVRKPTVLLPMAEGGRLKIAEKLAELGCTVTVVPLYRTKTRAGLKESVPSDILNTVSLLLFTSPSSVEAVTSAFTLPLNLKIAAIGKFTSDYLNKKGIANQLLPNGSFERVGEIL